MENIQFNPQDKEFQDSKEPSTPSRSTMVQWIIKYSGGLIKDETRANYVLLGIACIFFVLTIITILNGMDIGSQKTTYREDITPETRAMMSPEMYNSLPTRNTPR